MTEMLVLYRVLLDVWEAGWHLTREERPAPRKLTGWAAERLLPRVVTMTEAAGPQLLAVGVRRLSAGPLEDVLAAWLAGGELGPVERYLARATLWAPLVALEDDAGEACADDPSPRGGRYCPRCGGLPQLSFRDDTADPLVSGRRYLACARCGHTWSYSGSACPSCGDTSGGRRTVYSEVRHGPFIGRDADGEDEALFPHLRIDACTGCQRYLVDIDVGRDSEAVPEVDELAAVPLDMYATQHGVSKITPNLLGF
jgi:FdhE protein